MDKRLNILVLTTHINPGGITSYIFGTAKELIKKGHKVTVISGGGLMKDALENIGARVIGLDIKTKSELSPRLWKNFFRIKKLICDQRIDIIHAHTRVTQALAHFLSKSTKVRYATTCHGYFRPKWHRRAFGFWGDKVIAISLPVKEHLIDDLKVKAEKIEVIFNGIDISHFEHISKDGRAKAKQSLELPVKITIGIIARLSDVKGHEYLIRAFKNLLDKNYDVQLLIAGEGKLKDGLVELVKELDLKKSVFFKDYCLDTRDILRAIDIFCMPSLKEGLGLAVAEAQAAGIPVIVSKVGGLVNLVKDNSTGLLVGPKDVSGLTQALEKLLNDEALASRLAQEGEKSVRKDFSLNKMVLSIERLYYEIISN